MEVKSVKNRVLTIVVFSIVLAAQCYAGHKTEGALVHSISKIQRASESQNRGLSHLLKVLAQKEIEDKKSRARSEERVKKELSILSHSFEHKLTQTIDKLNSFQIRLLAAEKRMKERVSQMQKLFDERLSSSAVAIEKAMGKRLNQKIDASHAAMRGQFELEQKVVTDQYLKLFDTRIRNAYNELRKIATGKVQLAVLQGQKKAKLELGMLKKNFLDMFNKDLSLAKHKMEEGIKLEFQGIKKSEAKKTHELVREDAQRRIIAFEKRLKLVADAMTNRAEKKLEHLILEEKRLRVKNSEDITKKFLHLFESKVDRVGLQIKFDAEKTFQALVKKNNKDLRDEGILLKKQYAKLFESKLMVTEKQLEVQAENNLKKLLSEKEKEYAALSQRQKKGLLALTNRSLRIFEKKLDGIRLSLATEMSNNIERIEQNMLQSEQLFTEKSKLEWGSFIQKELALFSDKLATMQAEMRNENSVEIARTQTELDRISSEMLTLIERRLSTRKEKRDGAIKKDFDTLFSQLKLMNKTHGKEVRQLNKRLAQLKQELMDGEEERKRINQVEINQLVRTQVGKKMNLLNAQRDPRIKRLKKVVALEKMRRLLTSMVEHNDDEEE